MRTYDGPAVLVHGDVEVPVDVSLAVHSDGRMKSWDGTIEADDEHRGTFEAIVWDGSEFQLRLPEGGIGRAFVNQLSAGTGYGHLQGSGPAPW